MNSSLAIETTNLYKKYRLGSIGMTSLRDDLSRWWRRKDTSELAVKKESTAGIEKSRMINDSEFWALHDLNFQIPKGEVIGLIGANGSGKSTLLKILSRITEPTDGEVKIRGKVASLLEVGTGFHPELTGKENVYVNGAILGMTRREVNEKFEEIVDFAGVSDFIDTPIKRYSSGMTVRLGFAVAAHLNPDILIVDEVLAVGDAEFQKKCLGKMEGISRSGKTIIFVSHNMASIEAICSKAICLSKGNITTFGSTTSTIKKYLDDVTPQCSKSIKNRSDRVGTGEIIVDGVSFQDYEGMDTSTSRTGSFFSVSVDFKSVKNTNKRLVFCLSIANSQGQRITQLCTHFVEYKITQKPTFAIQMNIEKLNLQPGKYLFNTYLEGDGEPMDWIINAFEITVETGDFYGTGQILREGQGNTLIPFSVN